MELYYQLTRLLFSFHPKMYNFIKLDKCLNFRVSEHLRDQNMAITKFTVEKKVPFKRSITKFSREVNSSSDNLEEDHLNNHNRNNLKKKSKFQQQAHQKPPANPTEIDQSKSYNSENNEEEIPDNDNLLDNDANETFIRNQLLPKQAIQQFKEVNINKGQIVLKRVCLNDKVDDTTK